MKLLIPISEICNHKPHTKTVPIECQCCGKTFYTSKNEVQTALSDKKRERLKFCSRKCLSKTHSTKRTLQCEMCGKVVVRKLSDIYSRTFCSSSCCATYYNTHKTSGFNRSKLECWMESKLTPMYPTLDFTWNSREILDGLELDIYIPKYKLAFELNGLFHYEPVFGSDKLGQIQNRDRGKFQRCIDRGISLCVIDTTSMNYFKEDKAQRFLDVIRQIIDDRQMAESNVLET